MDLRGGGVDQQHVKHDKLICRARVVKPGRSMTVAAADVYSLEDGTERHVATALATIAVVPQPAKGD